MYRATELYPAYDARKSFYGKEKEMDILIIDAKRTGYSPEQCGKTLTVGELIDVLSDYEEDTPIYLSHDNGYTYGNIRDWDFEIQELREEN